MSHAFILIWGEAHEIRSDVVFSFGEKTQCGPPLLAWATENLETVTRIRNGAQRVRLNQLLRRASTASQRPIERAELKRERVVRSSAPPQANVGWNQEARTVDVRLAPLAAHARDIDTESVLAAVKNREVAAARRGLEGGVFSLFLANARSVENPSGVPAVAHDKARTATLLSMVPSPKTYGDQSWKWDLTFTGLVAIECKAHQHNLDVAAALESIAEGCVLSSLQNQMLEGPNRGLVPHMNFQGGADQALWKNARRSSLTQPPVIPIAVNRLADESLRQALYPAVKAELEWWLRERLDANGLPFAIHPWETGEDAARYHDSQMARYYGREPDNLALQTKNPGKKDAASKLARFALLQELQASSKKADELVSAQAKSHYAVRSQNLSALLTKSLDEGADLAESVGDVSTAVRFRQEAQRLRDAANRLQWDESEGFYFALGRTPSPEEIERSGLPAEALKVDVSGKIRVRVASSFLMLAAKIPSRAQALRMVEHLRSPAFNTALPIPTVASDDPLYVPDDYWRGSTWININYLVLEGLVDYADRAMRDGDLHAAKIFVQAALDLGWKTVEAVARGFYEYYAADGGERFGQLRCGPESFAWSALGYNVLSLIERVEQLGVTRSSGPASQADRSPAQE